MRDGRRLKSRTFNDFYISSFVASGLLSGRLTTTGYSIVRLASLLLGTGVCLSLAGPTAGGPAGAQPRRDRRGALPSTAVGGADGEWQRPVVVPARLGIPLWVVDFARRLRTIADCGLRTPTPGHYQRRRVLPVARRGQLERLLARSPQSAIVEHTRSK